MNDEEASDLIERPNDELEAPDPFEAAERRMREVQAQVARFNDQAHRLHEHAAEAAEAPFAAIPCPGCEGVNRFRVPDPPRPVRCRRCGETIDPREPFSVRRRVLSEVIEGTTGALVLLVAGPRHPAAMLAGFMGPALRFSHGRFVVAKVDPEAEPAVLGDLDLQRAPALVFYQGGVRMGAIAFPGQKAGPRGAGWGGGFLPAGLAQMLGGLATGAGLPFFDPTASGEGEPASGGGTGT